MRFIGRNFYILSLSYICLAVEKKIHMKISFSLCDQQGHGSAQEACPQVMQFYNFGRPTLAHHFYILILPFYICSTGGKGLFNTLCIYRICPCTRPPAKRSLINIFNRPFLCHHYYILNVSDIYLRVDKNISKERMYFHYMTQLTTRYNKRTLPRQSWTLQVWQTPP